MKDDALVAGFNQTWSNGLSFQALSLSTDGCVQPILGNSYKWSLINFASSPIDLLGGKLRGSLGKLPEFSVPFLLGMCLLADGDDVYSGLRGCLCKNHLGAPVYGLLHPWWFGKNLYLLNNILHAASRVSGCRDALHLLFTLSCFWGSPLHHQYVACRAFHELSTMLLHWFRLNAELFFRYLWFPIWHRRLDIYCFVINFESTAVSDGSTLPSLFPTNTMTQGGFVIVQLNGWTTSRRTLMEYLKTY